MTELDVTTRYLNDLPTPPFPGIVPLGYDLICGPCGEQMVHWPDERYHRCRTCGHTVYTTKTPRPTTPPPTTPSVVYFLKHGPRVKIGRTTSLRQRIASLSLEPTSCVIAILGGAAKETELHNRFAPYRIHKRREWFTWNDDIARWVEEHKAEDVKRQALRSWIP